MDGFHVEDIEISKLNPAPYNPRKDLQPGDPEYEGLKKSINEFGLVDPLVVNFDGTVIGGHQRLKILIAAGFDKVPCSVVNLDKQKEKALNIALNKHSGEWDYPKLKDIIVEIDDGTLDLEAIGWGQDELEEVFNDDYLELDDVLEEVDIGKAIKNPLWLVARSEMADLEEMEKAAEVLRLSNIKVILSTDAMYKKR